LYLRGVGGPTTGRGASRPVDRREPTKWWKIVVAVVIAGGAALVQTKLEAGGGFGRPRWPNPNDQASMTNK
jgi:hypothetical protein